MPLRILSPDEVRKLLEFGQKSYRPREIVEQQERIEATTRALEVKQASGTFGPEDKAAILSIVDMRFELERLYMDWVNGEIEDKPHIKIHRI